VASGVASLRSALQQGDMAAIRQETERLSQTVQKVGTAVYTGQAGAPTGNPEPGPTDTPEDSGPSTGPEDSGPSDTVEGDYREV